MWSAVPPSGLRRLLPLLIAVLLLPSSVAKAPPPPATPILDEWVPLPTMKHAADGVSAVALDSRIFVFGGSTNNSHSGNNGIKASAVLSTTSKTWNPLPGMSSGRCCAASQVHGDEVFIMGGMLNEDVFGEVEVYNVTANYWRNAQPLLTSRCCMAAVSFNGEIWVLGGGDNRGYALDVIEIYNPKTKKWRESSIKLPEPRTFFGAAVYEDSIIVVGGQVNYDAHTCAQKFYPNNPGKGWVTLNPPAYAHRAFGFTTMGDFLFVIGGMGKDTGMEPIAKVEAYDMKHDTWFTLTDLPGARDCVAAVVIENHLYAIGGFGPTDKQGKVLGDVLDAKVQLPRGTGKGGHKKPPSERKNHHIARWTLLLVILAAGLYGGVGAFLNYREGARGIEMAPHFEFWLEFPSLVMDGVVFLAAAATALFNHVRAKVGGSRYEALPEDDNPW